MIESDETESEGETPNPYANFTNRELAAEFIGKVIPRWVHSILPLASETEHDSRYASVTIKERFGIRSRKLEGDRRLLIKGRTIPIIVAGRRISHVAIIFAFIVFMVAGAIIRSLIG